jgi:cytochrome P450
VASPSPTLERPAEGFRPPATLDGLPARFAWFAEMRETTPVLRDEADGTWHVFRYEDVGRVLTDHAVFSNETVAADPAGGEAEGIAASMIAVDPPRHRQLRGLVSQVFTPKAVKALAPRIEALARDLLDPVRPRGTMDLIGEFASPLPVAVIAEMLGIRSPGGPIFGVGPTASSPSGRGRLTIPKADRGGPPGR